MTTVLVVDDHALFRAGMLAVLAAMDDVEVVGEAPDGESALVAIGELRPQVVLMDLRMPEIGGLSATARMAEVYPDVAVIVLTMSEDSDSIFAALRAGARGYLLKEAEADDVRRTIAAVAREMPSWVPASPTRWSGPLPPTVRGERGRRPSPNSPAVSARCST